MGVSLEEKAVEVLDKTLNGVETLSNMLVEIAKQHGAESVDAILTVVQIKGLGSLLYSSVLFFVPIMFFLFYRPMLRWARKYSDVSDYFSNIFLGFTTAGMGIILSIGMFNIINPWQYVAIVEPKLWIAHEILKW